MKKFWIAALIFLVVASAFAVGRYTGITHAICDSCIYTVDVYNPENPEGSAWNGYDQLIFIELDGETYMHGMYQG